MTPKDFYLHDNVRRDVYPRDVRYDDHDDDDNHPSIYHHDDYPNIYPHDDTQPYDKDFYHPKNI